MLFCTVYAENVTSALNGIDNSGFNSVVGSQSIITEATDNTADNITESVKLMTETLSSIGTAMSGFALALSVVVIAIIGFKVMNSGQGDILTFMKQRKEISNAIICILFILIIPTFVKSVLEFKPPEFLLSSVESTYEGDKYISDIIASPSSGLVDYMKDTFGSIEKEKSNKDFLADIVTTEDSFLSGLVKKLYQAVLTIISLITYSPLLLITSLVGSIGFYPVSLDVNMYMGDIVDITEKFFSQPSQSGVVDLGTNMISVVADGLKNLTEVINILYFIVKKFCMLCLEVVCYYFGIMHLLNKETEDVQKFLVRVAQGVIGMLLFPYFLEFLLDIDGVISMSILRLAGDSIPGFGMLAILPTVESATKGFCLLILSCAMAFVILMLAKSFFIRRIEISLLYISSPVFFLKHMMKSSNNSVKNLFERLLSSVFLTTVYAPVFAIISLMVALGKSETGLTALVYYILILGILWMGNGVIQSIIQVFAGSSSAAGSASAQFNKGIETFKGASKFAAGATAFGAVAGVMKGAEVVKNNGGLKETLKNMGSKAEDLYKNTANYMDKNGYRKTLGKALSTSAKAGWSLTKKAGKYAGNMAESKFWEKYEGAAKKYGGYTPTGAKEGAMKGRINYTETDSNNKKRMHDLMDKERRANFQDYVYKKYGDDPEKARKKMKDFDEMMKNNPDSKKFFMKNKSFFDEVKKFEDSKFVSQDTKDQIKKARDLFNTTNDLEQQKQVAIKAGRYEEAMDLEDKIALNKEFFTKNADKIKRAGLEEMRQGDRVDSFKAVNGARRTATFIPNDVKPVLTMNDSQTVNRALNTLLHETSDKSAQTKIQEFMKSGSVTQEGLTKLVSDLNTTGIDTKQLTSFANTAFNYDKAKAVSHVNLVDSLSVSATQRLANNVHSGYVGNNTELGKSLDILTKDAGANSEIVTAVNKFKSDVNIGGNTPPSAERVSQFATQMVADNKISREQAAMFLGATFGCTTADANNLIDSNIAKTVYNNNKSVVETELQKHPGVSQKEASAIIAKGFNISESQAHYVLEHNKDAQYKQDINTFDNSKGDILSYINLEANNVTQFNDARQVAEHITPRKQVSVLHGATSFRGVNVASAQLEKLKEEAIKAKNDEAKKRIELAQESLSQAKSNSQAESTMRQFFINESSEANSLDKSVLNLAAQTSLGFNSQQANVHLKGFVCSNIDTSNDVGKAYSQEIAGYKPDSDTNVLDYLKLTSGSNTDIYNKSAANLVDTILKDGDKGPLGLNLVNMKDHMDKTGVPITASDVESLILSDPKAVEDFIRNQTKTIKNGSQKVKELVNNIEDPQEQNQVKFIKDFDHKDPTKRNCYKGNTEDYRGSGAINPAEFEGYYIDKEENP